MRQAGGAICPRGALKMAGVDLTSPDPVRETFAVLAGLIDRLELLVEG
jgi:oligoendopeptidase F